MNRRTFLSLLVSLPSVAHASPSKNEASIGKILTDEEELFASAHTYSQVARERYDEAEAEVIKRVGLLDGTSLNHAILAATTIDDIFHENGYTRASLNRDLITRCLNSKRFDCDTGTLLYMCLGQKIKLDFRYVMVIDSLGKRYGHAFPRAHLSDGRTFNWEPLTKKSQDDQWYIDHFHIPPITLAQGTFMRSLTFEEAWGDHELVIANAWHERKRPDLASTYLERAKQDFPNNIRILFYLYSEAKEKAKKAKGKAREEWTGEMLKQLRQAETLAPDCVFILQGIATLYRKLGDEKKERDYQHRAIYYNPTLTNAEKTAGINRLYGSKKH